MSRSHFHDECWKILIRYNSHAKPIRNDDVPRTISRSATNPISAPATPFSIFSIPRQLPTPLHVAVLLNSSLHRSHLQVLPVTHPPATRTILGTPPPRLELVPSQTPFVRSSNQPFPIQDPPHPRPHRHQLGLLRPPRQVPHRHPPIAFLELKRHRLQPPTSPAAPLPPKPF